MSTFVLPLGTLALAFAVLLGVVLIGFVIAGLRNPLLPRLGLRTLARQRLRAALIVSGLALSSTVAGSALGAGDTISNTLRSLVAGSLGTVDEVVVLNPPRARLFQQAQALVDPGFGGLAAARLQFFDQNAIALVREAARGNDAIAAFAPSIIEQVTVAGEQQVRSAMPLLALPAPVDSAFGTMTDADGIPVAWDALGADQVVLNQAAADIFGTVAGGTLELVRGDDTFTMRAAAVIANGGLGGASPLLLVRLETYQALTTNQGRINQIIVANVGGAQSVVRSNDASRALRIHLTDLDVARQLHRLSGQPDIQRALADLEGDLNGYARDNIAALRREAAREPMSDEFVRLIAAPQVRQRLFGLAWRAGANGQEASSLLRRLNDLNVLDIKQEALRRAETFGSAITTIFLVLGIVSLVAAVLLVFLVFHLLAADRGVELATLRALGMRRAQIMQVFLVEGLAYNLAGAALGTAVSVGAVLLLARSIDGALAAWGVRLAGRVEPISLVLAFAGSAMVIFVAMVIAAYGVSRRAIIGATRGEPDTERPARVRVALGIVVLAAAMLLWWRGGRSSSSGSELLVLPITSSLITFGVATLVGAALRAWSHRFARGAASVMTILAALLIAAAWLPVVGGATTVASLDTKVIAVTVGTVVLLVVAVVLVAQALGPALSLVDRALVWMPRARAAARPAISYLQVRRGRAGMTIAMFAMVVTIMVAALTLIDALLSAYGSDEPPVGGFTLRGDVAAGTTFDLAAAWADAEATTPDAFTAWGGVASLDAQLIDLGAPVATWNTANIVVADDRFLQGIRVGVEQTPDAVDRSGAPWRALAEQPGTVLVVGAMLDRSVGTDAVAGRTLWVRAGGASTKLTVVGVADARSSLEAGVYVSRATAQRLGVTLPPPTTYYFAPRDGTRSTDAAQGLRISFGAAGLAITELDATAEIARSVRLVLTTIVQGFMGIGLVAGLAALALLGVQSVLERRQQLGTLRALGFRRADVRATLVWEGAIVAVLGLALGAVLGLVLARSVIDLIGIANPEIRFAVPWDTIAGVLLLGGIGAAGAIAVAAWQAGRVSPAEALRG